MQIWQHEGISGEFLLSMKYYTQNLGFSSAVFGYYRGRKNNPEMSLIPTEEAKLTPLPPPVITLSNVLSHTEDEVARRSTENILWLQRPGSTCAAACILMFNLIITAVC